MGPAFGAELLIVSRKRGPASSGRGDSPGEPNGKMDGWKTVGDDPKLVLVFVMEAVANLGPIDQACACASVKLQRETCRPHGCEPMLIVPALRPQRVTKRHARASDRSLW